jgi:hypothetical protein
MRWIVPGLVAVLLCAAPSAEAVPKRDCGPKSAHTVSQSATIRVFSANKRYYACWRRAAGKPVLLAEGKVEPPDSIGRFLLRGRFLTYTYTSCSPTGCHFSVEVLNVERRAAVISTGALLGSLRALVATRGGAAAFLAADGQDRYVQKLDSLGVEEIDRGEGVHSLTLHGGRLHWLNGTMQRDDHIAHVRRCGPIKGAQTEALTRNVRVYSTDPFQDDEYMTFACLLGGGKPLFLSADDPPSTGFTYNFDFQPIGKRVLWLEYQCYAGQGCATRIHRADLTTRKKLAGDWSWDERSVYPNARGFAAELLRSEESPPNYTLYAFGSAGETLLDKGPGIDPASVRVFTDSVVWRKDGEERRAPLR